MIADWLGFLEKTPPGEDKVPFPDQNYFRPIQLRRIGDEDDSPQGLPVYRSARFGNPNPTD